MKQRRNRRRSLCRQSIISQQSIDHPRTLSFLFRIICCVCYYAVLGWITTKGIRRMDSKGEKVLISGPLSLIKQQEVITSTPNDNNNSGNSPTLSKTKIKDTKKSASFTSTSFIIQNESSDKIKRNSLSRNSASEESFHNLVSQLKDPNKQKSGASGSGPAYVWQKVSGPY